MVLCIYGRCGENQQNLLPQVNNSLYLDLSADISILLDTHTAQQVGTHTSKHDFTMSVATNMLLSGKWRRVLWYKATDIPAVPLEGGRVASDVSCYRDNEGRVHGVAPQR